MNRVRVSAVCVLVAALAACQHDTDGELVQQPPLAGLRYVNLVPDTTALVFRVVDIVGDAPNTVNATFRTGGWPYGVATTLLPPHLAVLAGTRTIRVFLDGTTPAVASTQLLEITPTFEANKNYTVFLWGYANSPTNGTPTLQAMVVTDSVPTLDTASVAVRAIHLAGTLAPTLGGTAVDVTFDTLGAAAAPQAGCVAPRCAAFANLQTGEVRPYSRVTRRLAAAGPPAVTALNYRAVVSAAGSGVLGFQADVPNGTVGTSSANPIAGDLVPGSAITALVVPRSVAGTGAASFTTPTVLFMIDQRPPLTAP